MSKSSSQIYCTAPLILNIVKEKENLAASTRKRSMSITDIPAQYVHKNHFNKGVHSDLEES